MQSSLILSFFRTTSPNGTNRRIRSLGLACHSSTTRTSLTGSAHSMKQGVRARNVESSGKGAARAAIERQQVRVRFRRPARCLDALRKPVFTVRTDEEHCLYVQEPTTSSSLTKLITSTPGFRLDFKSSFSWLHALFVSQTNSYCTLYFFKSFNLAANEH